MDQCLAGAQVKTEKATNVGQAENVKQACASFACGLVHSNPAIFLFIQMSNLHFAAVAAQISHFKTIIKSLQQAN